MSTVHRCVAGWLAHCALSFLCLGSSQICKIDIHNMTIMRTHYEAKHTAVTLNEADYADD